MSKSVKYSIVVAVYNRPEEMEELLHSLNNQSFKNFELIIVDDGSQILSREVYHSYKKKFQISYYFTENQGPAMARNFGVNKASGEWIIFFDSDKFLVFSRKIILVAFDTICALLAYYFFKHRNNKQASKLILQVLILYILYHKQIYFCYLL